MLVPLTLTTPQILKNLLLKNQLEGHHKTKDILRGSFLMPWFLFNVS